MAMRDVEPHLYPSVIREMIRHENDVTNHRIMWLLIGQGLIANTYVAAGGVKARLLTGLASVGILIALSAFVILYKSYHARGYLQFLGMEAKRGALSEDNLPLLGWPEKRAKGWRSKIWGTRWFGQLSDLLEPYLFLPSVLIFAWLFVLLRLWLDLTSEMLLALDAFLLALFFSGFCRFWVWSQRKGEES
jgi:hypothetical protein